MATYILLSSVEYNSGFYPAATEFITNSLPDTKSLLLISSHVNDFEKTDNNSRALFMHFKKIGITFEKYQILDSRMPDCDQGRAIENASVIFLSGGDTLAQIDYIKAQGLLEPLRSHGYVIRYERRCNNMAKRSVILTNPYPERTWVYKGIGLVDLTVIAHFERYDYGFIESEIMPLTRDGVIYGIRDDAAIMVRDGRIRHGGMIYKMAHGQKQLIGTG